VVISRSLINYPILHLEKYARQLCHKNVNFEYFFLEELGIVDALCNIHGWMVQIHLLINKQIQWHNECIFSYDASRTLLRVEATPLAMLARPHPHLEPLGFFDYTSNPFEIAIGHPTAKDIC